VKLDVHFTPAELGPGDLAGRVAVVVDVLRATSTMVEALASGARGVYPVGSVEDAIRVARQLGPEQTLLCGERRSLPIEGFHLGNSPRECTAERVAGRTLVMTTTNGTSAVAACSPARRTLIGSFLNLGAVVAAVLADGGPVAVVCAGRDRRFAMEDALFAGALARELAARSGRIEANDAAIMAGMLGRMPAADLAKRLGRTAAARQLVEVGLEEDIAHCAMMNRYDVVPFMTDRMIGL